MCGLKQSGKDTVAAYLMKTYGFERRAFADPLKRSLAALFDIPFTDIEKLKTNTRMGVGIGTQSQANYIQPHYKSLTFRELLQRYGTESHRDIFGEDFWVDITLPNAPARYLGRNVVITDLRFKNESRRIRELGGKIVKITRPPVNNDRTGLATNDVGNTDLHTSEVIDFATDYTLVNSGTLEHLYMLVENFLAQYASTSSTSMAGDAANV